MKIEIPRQLIEEALINANLEPDEALRVEYSGRVMYGGTTFGIVGSESDFALFLVELAYQEDPDEGNDYARNLAQRVRSDSMGRSDLIFYFPGATLAED